MKEFALIFLMRYCLAIIATVAKALHLLSNLLSDSLKWYQDKVVAIPEKTAKGPRTLFCKASMVLKLANA